MANNSSTFETTKVALAKRLDITRMTLDYYLKMDGAPKQTDQGWRVEEVREFILTNSRRSATAANMDSDLATLRRWQTYESARKTKIANDLKEGNTISRSEVERQAAEFVAWMQGQFSTMPRQMATELAGQTPVEIEKRLVGYIDAVWVNAGKLVLDQLKSK